MTLPEVKSSAKVTVLRPRRGIELEFLPAALEVLETPASPMGRAIAATIILFFVTAIAWAIFGVVTTAPSGWPCMTTSA